MMKTLMWLLFCLTILPSAFAAEADVNLDDKLDSHNLKFEGVISGKVRVESKFVEEPVGSPVRIEVSVECLKKFRKVFSLKSPVWDAFDYGSLEEKLRLSTFDAEKQELTVYYRTSRVDQTEGRAVYDQALTRVFKLKDICKSRNSKK